MKKVIVLGSINMDIVVYVDSHPEIGETIVGDKLTYFPGGKGANQAIASARMGSKTLFLGRVGDDNYGETLSQNMDKECVDNKILKTPGVHTGTAHITVSHTTANNTIIVLPGANHALSKADLNNLNIESGDILVSQFEIPMEMIIHFFEKGRKNRSINILNPAPAKSISAELLNLVDILVVNETELSFTSGLSIDINDPNSIEKAVQNIKRPGLSILVTLGKNGAKAFTNDGEITIPGNVVKACDTTGAGDCFIGVLAALLAQDRSFSTAITMANEAASISVTRQGASPSMPRFSELSTPKD